MVSTFWSRNLSIKKSCCRCSSSFSNHVEKICYGYICRFTQIGWILCKLFVSVPLHNWPAIYLRLWAFECSIGPNVGKFGELFHIWKMMTHSNTNCELCSPIVREVTISGSDRVTIWPVAILKKCHQDMISFWNGNPCPWQSLHFPSRVLTPKCWPLAHALLPHLALLPLHHHGGSSCPPGLPQLLNLCPSPPHP